MKLIIPQLNELSYRKKILSDPDTMAYNKDYDLNLYGYDKKTGCIKFPESQWQHWYSYWIGREPERFYSYIFVGEIGTYIGEVALRYVEAEKAHVINVIIEAQYRGRGYGKIALELLLQKAFIDLKLKRVIDEIPVTRKDSIKLFERIGFRKRLKGNMVRFSLTLEQYRDNLNTKF